MKLAAISSEVNAIISTVATTLVILNKFLSLCISKLLMKRLRDLPRIISWKLQPVLGKLCGIDFSIKAGILIVQVL